MDPLKEAFGGEWLAHSAALEASVGVNSHSLMMLFVVLQILSSPPLFLLPVIC